MQNDKFILTVEHVALIKRFNVGWDGSCYLGSPVVDPKRPFGNGDVIGDMAEIVGIQPIETDDEETYWPRGTRDAMEKLYRELDGALQVVLASGSFEPGTYTAPRYSSDWIREEDEKATTKT